MFEFTEGALPVLVSIPHDGRAIPDAIADRMSDVARMNTDADWHVRRLYDFAAGLGANVIAARQSRYVVDLNRDPADAALYPGAVNTGIVPLLTFDGEPLYRPGEEPEESEVADRIAAYWQPYHHKLVETLEDLRGRFGGAVLFDAHSIRSEVPRLFDGRLADFNLGTSSGASADAELESRAYNVLAAANDYTSVLNGRFTGGYITRAYGRPDDGIHALQLELSQRTYMNEAPPFEYAPAIAAQVIPVLRELVSTACAWAKNRFTG